MKKLDKMQMDALRELASISSGNASTALSKLTGKMVKVTVSQIDVVGIKNLPKWVGGPKELIAGVYTPVTGDLSGNMLVIFPKLSALIISDLIQKKQLGMTEVLTKADQKALIEAGELISTTYLNALTGFLNVQTRHTNPRFISSFGESIVDFMLLGVREELKHALLLKTTFTISPPKIEGHFVLLLAVSSLDLLLELIKGRLGK